MTRRHYRLERRRFDPDRRELRYPGGAGHGYPHVVRNGVYRRGAFVAVAVAAVGLVAAPAPVAAAPGNIECGQVFTDTLRTTPWPLKWLQPQRAWPMSRGRDVIVAVIDSGISGVHPKLAGQLLPGPNMVPPASEKDCDNTHGTLVAAIIAARDDVAEQTYYGVAPDARILPIRVLPNLQHSSDPLAPKRIGDAIRYAVDHRAAVINLSLHTDPTDYLRQQIDYALSRNVVVVAAAGNTDAGTAGAPVYPAAYPGVIAVAGIDQNGKHADTSISGDYVSLAAPGVKIEGPGPQGRGYGLDEAGGTSFAAAYVSGTAALLRSYLPTATVTQIRRRMELTADAPPDGWDPQVGYGVVNPYRALGTILDPRTSVQLATPHAIPVQHVSSDPLATAKRVAAWVGPLGILVAVLLLMVRPVLRRGRARGWRTGSVAAESVAAEKKEPGKQLARHR
jgi:membrane-anchored mycosin MYCP